MHASWSHAIAAVLDRPQHDPLVLPREHVPHPSKSGFYRSIGLDLRARAHYRLALSDARGIHILDHGTHYHIHWDAVDPSVSIVRHILRDVPYATVRRVRLSVARRRPHRADRMDPKTRSRTLSEAGPGQQAATGNRRPQTMDRAPKHRASPPRPRPHEPKRNHHEPTHDAR